MEFEQNYIKYYGLCQQKNVGYNTKICKVICVLKKVVKKIVYKTIKIKYLDMLFSVL